MGVNVEELAKAGGNTVKTTKKKTRNIPKGHTLLGHFGVQSKTDHERDTEAAFRAHKRAIRRIQRQQETRRRQEKARQHRLDRTIGINTLNVRGLATDMQSLGAKLQGLKEQHARGNRDVVFLQETHLQPEEHGKAAGHHAAMWGFKQATAAQYSIWASGNDRRAGVAILINPYGAVTNLSPWKQDHWTEHLIMATGQLAGRGLLFINVYAPVNGAVRVQFFNQLRQLTFPTDVDIVCGGDFNCVLNEQVDRVGGTGRPELGAAELKRFLEANGLYDAGNCNLPDANEAQVRAAYATQHHTHFHVSSTGQRGSSRLDRFYISATAQPLVRGVETEEALCRTDHRAVLLELHSPRGVIRIRRRPKLYPPPAYVHTATQSLIAQSIQALVNELKSLKPSETAKAWDQFKQRVIATMKQLKKEAKGRMTRGYRQRIKRIKKQLEKCSQTDSTDPSARRSLVMALHQAQEARRLLKRRTVISQNAWSSTASTKAFFRRVCTKFGDSTIPTLVTTSKTITRLIHDKANILEDSWEETFNGQADEKGDMEGFIGKYASSWEKADLSDIDEDLTEVEVRAAIMCCKPGKACGPDELSNEWYKDNVELLVPVLTRLYNDCMAAGETPSSFLEAFIHSISKGGDTSNPLNYRPIALLNTDYKIFTRVIAWRVRRHIERLVSSRQFGFVPGRTIHEVIDLFEAAKERCSADAEFSQAQVLMLDFAKAYDSLDRDFLMAMLVAKGFPPRFCRIVRAIHTNTTVRFLANGSVSGELKVTNGIRQGCPLAPLLFILAVDLLYDVLETESSVQGIELTKEPACRPLKVAGYADDTAIYIAHAGMQTMALRAVQSFSAVSGLRLNVKKSVALNLGNFAGPEGETEQGDGGIVSVVEDTRYLGHIAGTGDTTQQAWSRAMEALRIRLVLAEAKTNTVQQRGKIAAAIILPKLLYVARHPWPSEDVVQQAQRCLKTYVWRSKFADVERPPTGWIQADLAEQHTDKGGMGIPNLRVELIAMSAMVVGDWALTYNVQQQEVGAILQTRDNGSEHAVVPRTTQPAAKIKGSLWGTGRPWTEWGFGHRGKDPEEDRENTRRLRKELRFSNGVNTKWSNDGLHIRCEGMARRLLMQKRNDRHKDLGECCFDGIMATLLTDLTLGDACGIPISWAAYRRLYTRVSGVKLEEVMQISRAAVGSITILPLTHLMPMTSTEAHCFREVALCVVANYPELVCRTQDEEVLTISHNLEDPHHVFTVTSSETRRVLYEWGSECRMLDWTAGTGHLTATVARDLAVPPQSISIAPHPWLNRMRPLWVGKRRWTQSRKMYKALINMERDKRAEQAKENIQKKISQRFPAEAKAMAKLEWRQIHRMEGASPYMTQNIMKFKLNRLRLWTSDVNGFQCLAAGCSGSEDGGSMHLAWACPEAQQFWEMYMLKWGKVMDSGPGEADRRREAMENILGFNIHVLPEWLVRWGQHAEIPDWCAMHMTAQDLWKLGAAVVLTSIWRRNIDRGFPNGSRTKTLEENISGAMAGVAEAFARYKLGKMPLTASSLIPIRTTEEIMRHWRIEGSTEQHHGTPPQEVRIGFFDGGSCGNLGPGGSGSVCVEKAADSGALTIVWAAATALSCPTMTNNVAEFIGLHRLLAYAAAQGWTNIHVVGDSAMILRLMRTRTAPKSAKLKHWFTLVIRLADICQVASWTHHYREHNKMADWLANVAMDERRSTMVRLTEADRENRWMCGLQTHKEGDVQEWLKTQDLRKET